MKLLFFTFFILLSNLSYTQSKTESIDYVFDSNIFNEKRTISVFLPEAYHSKDSTKAYAVAYLFDAQFEPYFSMVSSIMSYYEQSDEGVPLIIVGIHTENRWDEFAPISKKQESKTIEGADRLTLFLSKEVIPYIASNYRTNNFNIGIGHSLGGTYVVNEVIKQKSLFNAVIAISPNLTMYEEQIVNDGRDFFTNNPDNYRYIYAAVGTVDDMEQDFNKSLMHLDAIHSNMNLKNMIWHCEVLENHNHMTTFVPAFNAGYLDLSSNLLLQIETLIELADDTTVSIVEGVNSFYSKLSKFSQKEIPLTSEVVLEHATTLAQYEKHEACIQLCQYARLVLAKENIALDKKKELGERIDKRQTRAIFNALANEAKQLVIKGNLIEASEKYIEAFSMNLIKATHRVRMAAVPVFAQSGKIEEAFEQLDLLANTFELGGNNRFINDMQCESLHDDKRWNKYMNKLEKNGELY